MEPDSSVDLKHIRTSLFSIPALFADAGRSPTSPLDFGVFANFGGLFSPKSSSSPRFGHRNRWVSDKVGLSLLSSTIGQGHEARSDSFTRDNIVLAPQIKLNVITPPTQLSDPCVIASNSLPKKTNDLVEEHNINSPMRSSSSPVDIIIPTQAYSRSLSGHEMALSEDYTCIISHGPNPKTTHIFGDCILDCDPKELGGVADPNEEIQGDSLPNNSPVDSFSQLCLCTGIPQDCRNSHIPKRSVSGLKNSYLERTFSDIFWLNNRAEKEIENAGSLDVSPGSSYNENMFPINQ